MHTFALESFDQPGQLAQRKPVHRGGPALLDCRRRFFLDGGDNDVVPLRASTSSTSRGKLPFPAMRPIFFVASGMVKILTPRVSILSPPGCEWERSPKCLLMSLHFG